MEQRTAASWGSDQNGLKVFQGPAWFHQLCHPTWWTLRCEDKAGFSPLLLGESGKESPSLHCLLPPGTGSPFLLIPLSHILPGTPLTPTPAPSPASDPSMSPGSAWDSPAWLAKLSVLKVPWALCGPSWAFGSPCLGCLLSRGRAVPWGKGPTRLLACRGNGGSPL